EVVKIYEFNVKNEGSFDLMTDIVRDRKIHSYSYASGSMTSKSITNAKTNASMPSLRNSNNGYVPLFKFPYKFGDFSKHSFENEAIDSRFLLGAEMKKAFFYSQVLSGKVMGELDRMAGRHMLITNAGNDDSVMKQYQGSWISSRVAHEIAFHDNSYRNIIHMSRFDTRDLSRTMFNDVVAGNSSSRIA
nr:hypothetical protein [Candidatus Sigynarchaeota archaeon]